MVQKTSIHMIIGLFKINFQDHPFLPLPHGVSAPHPKFVFPQGRLLEIERLFHYRGWSLLISKLRSLGVRPTNSFSVVLEDANPVQGVSDKGYVGKISFANAVRNNKRGVAEVVWV